MKKSYKKYLTQLLAVIFLMNSLYVPGVLAEEVTLADHVIISQVYGGGGNSGAEYKNDFIELYNPTSASVDLTGWSVQYASSTGTFSTNITQLTGFIGPGEYYLIQEAKGSGGTIDLPTPDASGSIAMSGTNGKVALAKKNTAITSMNDTDVVDFVGYGIANEYETAATPALSNTTAAIRKVTGVDTDNNLADFVIQAPKPSDNVVVITKCETPTASVASGAVANGSEVVFSTTTPGASIEYNTVSETEETWTTGTSVTITEAVTYYVRATLDSVETSDVATFSYIIDASSPIDIIDAKNLPVDTENVKVKGIITYISGRNVYVQDDTAAICLFLTANASALKLGDEVIASGKRANYYNLLELTGVEESAMTVVSTGNTSPVTEAQTIEALIKQPTDSTAGFNHMCEIVKIKEAVLTSEGLLSQNGFDIKIYPTVNMSLYPEIALGDPVDLTVRMYDYKGTLEVAVVALAPYDDGSITIKDALALASGTTNVKVKGQIAYFAQSYNNPVLQSEIDGQTYSLYVYGAAPDGAKVGDIVTLTGTYSVYKGLPELMSIIESKIVKSATPFSAEVHDISDILTNGKSMIGRFVKIEGVTLGTYTTSNTPITDGVNTINIYKAAPYPYMIEAGDVVDVYAMVACYNDTIQLYTGTKEANGFNVYDVVNDVKNPVLTLADSFLNAQANQDYLIFADAQDNKGIASVTISYQVGSTNATNVAMTYNTETARYEVTIPASEITQSATEINFAITATDVSGLSATSEQKTVIVENKPVFTAVSPSRNTSTGDDQSPVISVTVDNAGVSAEVTLTLKKDQETIIDAQLMSEVSAVPMVYGYSTSVLSDGSYSAMVTVLRADGKSESVTWTFFVGTPDYQAYFGQLHSHTAQYSDGSGSLADGLAYIDNISDSDNVDFVAFTDHSNYFDTSAAPNIADALNDKTLMSADSLLKWNNYVSAMADFNASQAGDKVALAGFEMTWSGGPGHINTFNSDGLVSRNNTTLNNKTADSGMKAYYETLIKNSDPLANISQFNHPGSTFGTFADFSYWTPAYDNKMVAVEVGNGEGAIGSGGYFASYSEYTKALDKGWHVAPTNNQDNHKGHWGNANTARTVILTDNLSSEGLLTGLKNMSVYATEDKNLTINYTVNDLVLGSIISEVPSDPLRFNIQINDADQLDVISKVEIVTNSGRVAASQTFDSSSVDWSFELAPLQGYYYVRVTEADMNMAVTAPVWVGQAPLVGINSLEANTKMPVTNEELTLTTTVFNNESSTAILNSIEYFDGDTVIGSATVGADIVTAGTYVHTLKYTPTTAKETQITAKVEITLDGQSKSYSQTIDLTVYDSEKLVYVGIDASHFNEYVRGNYKDSMGNFANMAVEYGVRVVELDSKEQLMAAMTNPKYKMLILTTPTRRSGSAILSNYKNYEQDEVDAVAAYAKAGNTVIVTGWGDYYESYTKNSIGADFTLPASDHMSVQQNRLLQAMGSRLRISDDEVKDDVTNGGQAQRLYLTEYNLDNPFLSTVIPSAQVYSNYGGSTIYAVGADGLPSSVLKDSVSPMVYSFTTSYSSDDDHDGTTGITGVSVPKYADKYMVAASENISYDNGNTATIIAAGSVFMSNFEVQIELDSYSTPAYSNYTILEEILKTINPVVISDIADVQAAQEGQTFTIRGIATSNASGYDKETAFFDCIYVQDATAGINAFPVADSIQAGQTVEITGKSSSYNGERQILVQKITVIDATVKALPEPIVMSVEEVSNADNLGSLVTVSGKVHSIESVNNVVESIIVKNGSDTCRIFIDGYITKDKLIDNLKVGAKITVVGLMSIDTIGSRIRVRDRSDIICYKSSSPKKDDETIDTVIITDDETPLAVPSDFVLSFSDIKSNHWFFNAVRFLAANKFTLGTSLDTYSPDAALTRGQFIVILMRAYGIEPDEVATDNFLDAGNTYYTNYLSAAKRLGLTSGIGGNRFAPEEKITRQDMFSLLYIALASLDKLPEKQGVVTLDDFTDADQIAEYAVNAMKSLVEGGVVTGNKGKLNPLGYATRAEMAQVIYNLLGR